MAYRRNLWGDDDDVVSSRSYYGRTGVTRLTYNKSGSDVKRTRNTYDWSSYYSYLGWGDEKDNNDSLIVKDPITYQTPTKKDIKQRLKYVRQEESVNLIKELSRVCYLKMFGDKDFLHENWKDESSVSEEEMANYQKKKALFESVYENFIPGYTPLEQAIAIYLKLDDGTDETYDSSNAIERMDEKGMNLDFDRALYTDPTINEQLEFNELSKSKKIEVMNLISIIGDLGSEFKVEKEVDEKIVANSDTSVNKVMRDYSQFHMLNMYQKMLPTFRTKLLTKDLIVNVPVERKEQKQKIIIILDFSGSMHCDEKQIWVNAILIDRFRYVMKGEAEVFFSYFVHNPNQMNFQHIKNREDVINFWQTFSNNPNGGTTEVGKMVERIAYEVEQKRLMNLDVDLSEEKPEILVINDGQDDINIDKFPYKVNAICLFEYNSELKDLCVETGGKKVYVDNSDVLTLYSKEGEQYLKNK